MVLPLPLPLALLRSRSCVKALNNSFLVSVGSSPKQGGLRMKAGES